MSFSKDNYYQEKFTKITLSNELVKSIEFEECQFTDCCFVNCTFEKCKFISCIFNDCMISALIPVDTRFVATNFNKSKVMGIDWTKSQHLQDSNFKNCQINYSNFRMLQLSKIQMIDCEAKEADFTGANLTEGIFTHTDFEGSVFLDTNLTKADFAGAKNYSIDARYNIIKKAHFSLPDALSLLNGFDIVIEEGTDRV